MLKGRDRRPTGECEVEFYSHEQALEGMKYDKKYIGTRYIELFLMSEPDYQAGHGSKTPPDNSMLSLGTLMTKDFSSSSSNNPPNNNNNNRNLNSLFTNFDSFNSNGIQPVPPPAPLSSLPSIMPAAMSMSMANNPQGIAAASYSTNINELLMAEMAQKMFASAYSHFQQQQQQQQHQQQPSGVRSANNYQSRRF